MMVQVQVLLSVGRPFISDARLIMLVRRVIIRFECRCSTLYMTVWVLDSESDIRIWLLEAAELALQNSWLSDLGQILISDLIRTLIFCSLPDPDTYLEFQVGDCLFATVGVPFESHVSEDSCGLRKVRWGVYSCFGIHHTRKLGTWRLQTCSWISESRTNPVLTWSGFIDNQKFRLSAQQCNQVKNKVGWIYHILWASCHNCWIGACHSRFMSTQHPTCSLARGK